jgi:hypothetical protein
MPTPLPYFFNETSACDMSVPYNIFVTSLYYVRVPYNIFVTPLYCDRVPYNICVAPFLYCDRVYHIASLWRPFIVTCIPNSINLCDVRYGISRSCDEWVHGNNKGMSQRCNMYTPGADSRFYPQKNMIFWGKIVIFHTKYPKIFSHLPPLGAICLSAPPPPNLKSWIRP